MQTDKDSFVSIRKIYEKPGSTTCLLLPVSRNQFVIWLVFEQASLGITSFNMIVELGSLNIITYSVNNEVTKFIKIMFTVVRKWKGLLRLERDNTMKLKRKEC